MLAASDLATVEDSRLVNFPDDHICLATPQLDLSHPSNRMRMAVRHRDRFAQFRRTKETSEYIVRRPTTCAAKDCSHAARTRLASHRAPARAAETYERRAHCESSTGRARARTRVKRVRLPRTCVKLWSAVAERSADGALDLFPLPLGEG